MLIKNCIYCIAMLLSLFSVVSLICSIKNKDKYICKKILAIDILYIVYMIMDFCMIGIFYVPIGLEVLLLFLFALIAGILYIVSIIINLIKIKKLEECPQKKKIMDIIVILIIFPILFLSTYILINKYLIDNSNLIMFYHSDGNGSIGDG